MAELLVSEVLVDSTNTYPATIETNGLLVPWEVFDELGVSVANRDKADAIIVALLKALPAKYPVVARETDPSISITANISRGFNDTQVDGNGVATEYDAFEVSVNLYALSQGVTLDPSKFVTSQ